MLANTALKNDSAPWEGGSRDVPLSDLELESVETYCLFMEIECLRGKDDDSVREMKFLRVMVMGLTFGWRGVRE